MYSFYGGRPGNAFIVVASFESIEQMVNNFKKGPNYNDVHYDEYVLISNEKNKDSSENGKIFRRGYDFTNTMGGAEYIGCIVGPSGSAPHLELKTYQGVKDIATANHVLDSNGQVIESNALAYRYTELESALANNSLIPGKDGSTFNDKIKWNIFSVRSTEGDEEGVGTVTTAFIGFKIPYPVFDFNVNTVDYWENSNAVKDVTAGNHPFYNKWNINIPKGQKGDSFGNFRIISTPSDISNVTEDENYTSEKKNADIIKNGTQGRSILVYDYITHNPDNSSNEPQQVQTLYIGDYNSIEDIQLKENGILTVTYSHEKEKDINEYDSNDANAVDARIKWIKKLELNSEGQITLTYNTDENQILDEPIKWVQDVLLASDGTLHIKYNTSDETEPVMKLKTSEEEPAQPVQIKWIDNMQIDESGQLQVKYNTSSIYQPLTYHNPEEHDENYSQTIVIKFIKTIELDDRGILKVTYNDESSEELNPLIYNDDGIPSAVPLKWITSVGYADGILRFEYNTNENQSFDLNPPTGISIRPKTVSDSLGNYTQDILYVNYAHGNPTEFVLNSVNKMTLSDDGHLLVQYTDGYKNTSTLQTTTLSGEGSTTQPERWADLGLIDPNVFKFEDTQTIIQDKALIGILSKNVDNDTVNLEFDLSPSQFISKYITSAYISETQLSFEYLNTQYQIQSLYTNNNINIQLNSPFGIKVIIQDVPEQITAGENFAFNEEGKVLVNLLIKLLHINFEIENNSSTVTALNQSSIDLLRAQIADFKDTISGLSTAISTQVTAQLEEPKETIEALSNNFDQLLKKVNAAEGMHQLYQARKCTFRITQNGTTMITGDNAKCTLGNYLDRADDSGTNKPRRTNYGNKDNNLVGNTRLFGKNVTASNNGEKYFETEGVYIPDVVLGGQYNTVKNGLLLQFANSYDGKYHNNNFNWFFLPKEAPYGNNTNIFLSKPAEGIIGGKVIKYFYKWEKKEGSTNSVPIGTYIAGSTINTTTQGSFYNGHFTLTRIYEV